MANLPNQLLASDTGQRADENPLSDAGQWTTLFGGSACQLTGHLMQGTVTNVNNGVVWTGVTWPNDHASEVTIQTLTGVNTNIIALLVRASTSAKTWYQLALEPAGSTGQPALSKVVNNVQTLIKNLASVTYASGDVWTFQAAGALLSIYQNGNLIDAVYDSGLSITSGSPGFIFFNPTGQALTTTQISSFRGYSTVQQDGIWSKIGVVVPPITTDLGFGSNNGTANPTIIFEGNSQVLGGGGNVYKMWFASGQSLAYAESTDGINWTRSGGYLISGVGWAPSVLKVGTTYHLYAQAGTGAVYSVQHYTSTDGINWSAGTTVFNLGTAGQWDDGFLTYFTPFAILGGTWYAYYTAAHAGGSDPAGSSTGLATSPDGLVWTRSGSNPLIHNFWGIIRPVNVGGIWYAWGQTRNPNQTGTFAAIDPGEGIRYQSLDLINWTNPVKSLHHSQLYEGVNAQSGGCFPSFVMDVNGKAYCYGTASTNENATNPTFQIWLATAPTSTAGVLSQPESALQVKGTDNGQRANENPLSNGGLWTSVAGQGTIQLLSNFIEPVLGNTSSAVKATGTFSPDQYSSVTLGVLGSAFAAPIVRVIDGNNFYYADLHGPTGSTDVIRIHKLLTGVDTVLGPTAPAATMVNSGDVFTLSIVGNNLQLFQNGYLLLQVQDLPTASITSGAPGILENATSGTATDAKITAWAGGNANVLPNFAAGGSFAFGGDNRNASHGLSPAAPPGT